MLKSFEIIEKLQRKFEELQNKDVLDKFLLDLHLNQNLVIYLVSNELIDLNSLTPYLKNFESLERYNIDFEFLTPAEAKDEEYSYLFKSGETVRKGLRRSLDSLIDQEPQQLNLDLPIVTFYSYKGGVGRTTALALFAQYYANTGKRVFVIDCDFEAPGLSNFFGISQFETPKSGIVEYINDRKFEPDLKLGDKYVYSSSSEYGGEGHINVMAAGDLFSERSGYLEALSRVDVQGKDMLLHEFIALFKQIKTEFNPDVILIDSRTGFNNVYGTLARLSNFVVGFSGDDEQNLPGRTMMLDSFVKHADNTQFCLILSILAASIPTRTRKFKQEVTEALEGNVEPKLFFIERTPDLELVGTALEVPEDVRHYISSPTSTYHDLFKFLTDELQSSNKEEIERPHEQFQQPQELLTQSQNASVQITDDTQVEVITDDMAQAVLDKIGKAFDELYAENKSFEDEFFNSGFYVRLCMQDIFLSDRKILLGGKGTGKTEFYKALQEANFFDLLIKKAQKQHLNYLIAHVIDVKADQATENFFNFTTKFKTESDIYSEWFVDRFWLIWIWLTVCRQSETEHEHYFKVKNDEHTAAKFRDIINDNDKFRAVEQSLEDIQNRFKSKDERLILVFDQLDKVIKPKLWDIGIAPLIRLVMSGRWTNVEPKLFVRRDLFDKLGNLTNSNALTKQTIDLEWQQEELYAFFFKVVFAHAKEPFKKCINAVKGDAFTRTIVSKLEKKNQLNQLPPEKNLLEPLVELFFGRSNRKYTSSTYELVHFNLRNANRTINLRPFMDMIRLAINKQNEDKSKKRGTVILNAPYWDNNDVREKAVKQHFRDLIKEEGNELLKVLMEDIRDAKVSEEFKCTSLDQNEFEDLVNEVKSNHPEHKKVAVREFEEILVFNGIIFVTYSSASRKKYSFAYLYKAYLNLVSPKARNNRVKKRKKKQ